LYGVVAALALGELAILVLALRPDVHPDYRAYYLDLTTTCLPRHATGDYKIGTSIRFLPGEASVRPVVGCGWQGPAGNGLHAVGTLSQLHLKVPVGEPLSLEVELIAAEIAGTQPVEVSVDETPVGAISVSMDSPTTARFALQPQPDGHVTVGIAFPQAVFPYELAPDIDRRSIRLLSLTIELQAP
jgi:hypothetical protein